MTLIALLFVVGFILLAFEVFVPGAILGIFGGLALLGGVVLSFLEHGAGGGFTALGVAALLAGLMFTFEFVILPRTPWGRRMFLRAEVGGTSQPPVADAASVVGRMGEAVTPLSPTGYILVDGRRYEASSRSGQIARGDAVRVVGLDTFRLLVTKTSSP